MSSKTGRVKVQIDSLTFSDGTVIGVGSTDIIVLVGPNNAGKSVALRDIEKLLLDEPVGPVVKEVTLSSDGTVDDLHTLIHAVLLQEEGGMYTGLGVNIFASMLADFWDRKAGTVNRLFFTRVSTQDRITGSNAQNSLAVGSQIAEVPLQRLFLEPGLEERLNQPFREAFGVDLIAFHGGGSRWPLRVGVRPSPESGEDRVSPSYIRKVLNSTSLLESQGDGMRSFVTVLLDALASAGQNIILLDEPEAFLHPPQARLLGEVLARERNVDTQLIIATHSQDFLQGLLNVASRDLRIIRLQRNGVINSVKELDREETKNIGNDPLMRYTSVMSGIFHKRVFICESDSDCMFYNAILDLPSVHGQQYPDVLFTQAAGKHRMERLTRTLRSMGVNVDVIADIDVLNDLAVLEKLVGSLGGDWRLIEVHARRVKNAIEQKRVWADSEQVTREIQDILKNAPKADAFPKRLREDIEGVLQKTSPWDAIKQAGKSAIPAGDATATCNELLKLCGTIGLWIVPVGELEGFCKSIGSHGPKWVQNVLQSVDIGTSADLGAARAFVKEIWERIPSGTN